MITFIKHYRFLIGSIFFGLVCLGSLFGLLVLYFDSKTEDTQVLTAKPAEIDFGDVEPDIKFCSFKLTNTSRYPLEILRVIKSCSCTEIFYQSGELAPQAVTELFCNFDTGSTAGIKTANIGIIYVYRGDPRNQARKLDVSIRATVKNTDGFDNKNSQTINEISEGRHPFVERK
ncbi:MAG: DUF1573 domain-containing protein [Planctomycetaceae bacterium]|jgi:hypothetical protein|nr:DUF1573 domain-containing protein [Planctomycetaceae bacterium]